MDTNRRFNNKLTLVIVSFVITIGQLSAQSFIHEIDLGREEEITDIIQLSANKFIVSLAVGDSGAVFPEFPDFDKAEIAIVDSAAQLLKSTHIDYFYPIQLINLPTSLLVYGIIDDRVSFPIAAIYKIDYQLNILDSITIYSNLRPKPIQITKKNNKEIIALNTYVDTNKNIYVSSFLRLDTNLSILDTAVYDTVSLNAIAGIITQNNDLLIYQSTMNYRQIPFFPRNPIFVVDSTGQKLKQASTVMPVFNPQLGDSLMIRDYPSLEELPNRNVVLSGILQNQQSHVPGSSNYVYDYGVIVYDSNMNYVNHQVIGLIDTVDFPAASNIAVVDSSFYIAGVTQWYPDDYYRDTDNFIRVNQFDFEGNLINSRNYTVGHSTKIISIKPTEDKGLVLVGSNYNKFGGTGGINGLFIKLDSLGNLTETGIKETNGIINPSNYLLYPNPAKNELNLLKLNQFEPYEFELYDTFGRLVKTAHWREDLQQLDISSLASGMYVYRIIDEKGNVGSGKLIVE